MQKQIILVLLFKLFHFYYLLRDFCQFFVLLFSIFQVMALY